MKKFLSILLSLLFVCSMVFVVPAGAESKLYNDVPNTIKVNGTTFTGTYNAKSKQLTYKSNKKYYEDFEIGLYNIFAYAMQYQSSDNIINQNMLFPEYNNTLVLLSIAFNDMVRTGKIRKIKFDYGKLDGYAQGWELVFKSKNNHTTQMSFNVEEAGGETWNYSYDKQGNIKKISEVISGDYIKVNQKDGKISSIVYYSNDQATLILTPTAYDQSGYISTYNAHGDDTDYKWSSETDSDNNLSSISETITYSNGKVQSTPKVEFTYMKI